MNKMSTNLLFGNLKLILLNVIITNFSVYDYHCFYTVLTCSNHVILLAEISLIHTVYFLFARSVSYCTAQQLVYEYYAD